jgi:hypothetical protein
VANLFVIVELVGERPHPASLEVLGQARRVGTGLGATVYAVAPCARPPGYEPEDLVAVLSQHGADKVLLAVSPSHAGPLRWGTHGAAVLVACATMQPLLLLLADTRGGRDLGPRLAARLGAAYLGGAAIEMDADGIVLWDVAGAEPRRLEGELDFTVVAAVPPGRYPTARGDEEAEIELLETPGFPGPDFVELPGEPPAADAAVLARVVGEGAAATELAAALAGRVDGAPCPAGLEVTLDGSSGGDAEVRVALGSAASAGSAALYAVEGDADDLARRLAAEIRDRCR